MKWNLSLASESCLSNSWTKKNKKFLNFSNPTNIFKGNRNLRIFKIKLSRFFQTKILLTHKILASDSHYNFNNIILPKNLLDVEDFFRVAIIFFQLRLGKLSITKKHFSLSQLHCNSKNYKNTFDHFKIVFYTHWRLL